MRACYPINFLIFIIRGRKNVHRTTYRAGVAAAAVAAGVGVAVGAVGKTNGVAKAGGATSAAPISKLPMKFTTAQRAHRATGQGAEGAFELVQGRSKPYSFCSSQFSGGI